MGITVRPEQSTDQHRVDRHSLGRPLNKAIDGWDIEHDTVVTDDTIKRIKVVDSCLHIVERCSDAGGGILDYNHVDRCNLVQ